MYKSIDDLPAAVSNEYPREACELYLAVYNRILEKETMNEPANDAADILPAAETAHEAALLAIHAEFDQDSDSSTWHRASIGNKMKPPGVDADNT